MSTLKSLALCIALLIAPVYSCAQEAAPAPSPRKMASLPPLPTGVTDLKWDELFHKPVGPRGLTLSDKLRTLDGKRVRLQGYMVRREADQGDVFLLTARPLVIDDYEGGLSDLPPGTVHVLAPGANGHPVPFTPRPLLLIGTLSIGNRTEPDGSISLIRLTLDEKEKTLPPSDTEASNKPIETGAKP